MRLPIATFPRGVAYVLSRRGEELIAILDRLELWSKEAEEVEYREFVTATECVAPIMNILSIQSHVAYGHVGNAAAVFPLQRIGVEVWPVNTVQFSNHTGYGAWTGTVFGADHIRDVVKGIEDRGVFSSCDGVLSGYMGSAEIGEAILDAVARVKRANPTARYCCDPVIGDIDTGVYVREGIPDFIRTQGAGDGGCGDAQSVRAWSVVRPRHRDCGRPAGGNRLAACARHR